MLTFLFWNLGQKPLAERLARMVWHYEVDVVVLAECAISTSVMLKTLNHEQAEYHAANSECEKIAIYTKFPPEFIETRVDAHRWTIRHLQLPGRPNVLLVAAHLPSTLRWKPSSQPYECVELANEIRHVEQETGCERTVLVGDLNMNPFESGVFSAGGLHAVMTRRVAARKERKVQGRRYQFFYNPMWNRFGDETKGAPGTYFYQRAEHDVLFWNMFDQVLLRPELLPYFKTEELKILSEDGKVSLLSAKGIPDSTQASDHLPILFKLHL
jgi:endonuclease/exonuclease/phosphatase family metal-dependent hydrolase